MWLGKRGGGYGSMVGRNVLLFIFFIIVSGVGLSPLGPAATTGLLYQPQRVIVEQLVELSLAGETEVLRQYLLQCHFVHHKSHMMWLGFELGPPRWDARD
jgi:hypothetical protein